MANPSNQGGTSGTMTPDTKKDQKDPRNESNQPGSGAVREPDQKRDPNQKDKEDDRNKRGDQADGTR